MVNLVVSSSELHSSTDIEVGLVVCRIAPTYRQLMSTLGIISFQRVKFFPSNFRVSIFVSDCVAILLLEVDIFDLVF